MDGYAENGDVSGGYGSMNINTLSQHNGLSSLINYNNSDGIKINGHLKKSDVSFGNCLIKNYNIYQ